MSLHTGSHPHMLDYERGKVAGPGPAHAGSGKKLGQQILIQHRRSQGWGLNPISMWGWGWGSRSDLAQGCDLSKVRGTRTWSEMRQIGPTDCIWLVDHPCNPHPVHRDNTSDQGDIQFILNVAQPIFTYRGYLKVTGAMFALNYSKLGLPIVGGHAQQI